MKADISRQTFDSNKRYSGVVMQQGRVQLDAEWNEQQEIHQHRAQSDAREVIGPSGAPIGEGGTATGFEITVQDGRLCVGGGHIHVGGVLCVNESEDPLPIDEQPDLPSPLDLTGWMEEDEGGGGFRLGLVYLDVWERHVTHFDDARIREVALGGPDTTTRKQTVWQVKVLRLDEEAGEDDLALLAEYAGIRAASDPSEGEAERLKEISPLAVKLLGELCSRGEDELADLAEPPTGKLSARVKAEDGAAGPCQIPPGGGYTRLENQLYRIEIHRPGNRSTARYKWSRDNGSVVTGIEAIDAERREITVRDTGRDEFLRFAPDQWVEVSDDRTELEGRPRELLKIEDVDHARRVVTVRQTPPEFAELGAHPKLRRWDQSAEGATRNGVELAEQDLENDGVEVEFGPGQYRAGDYWLIPARTVTGGIEWPLEDPEDPNSGPEAIPPHGVRHGLSALTIVAALPEEPEEVSEDLPPRLAALHDCRRAFPRLTDLSGLFYLGGGGQEAMPGGELPEPLRVGVASGQWPVGEVRVRFEAETGTLVNEDGSPGRNEVGEPDDRVIVVLSDAGGVASCRWTLDGENRSQRVTARLLGVEDDGGGTLSLPIRFNANLSVAGEVAYSPGEVCKNLVGVSTVQEALDELCKTGENVQGIVIKDVRTIEPDASLPNDASVQAPVLASGLRVVCDTPVDPESVEGKPTCFVTLEMPYPLIDAERELWGTGDLVVGFRPLVLRGEVRVEEESVLWTPANEGTREWIRDALFATLAERFREVPAILARLTLKGNFIWSRDQRLLFLDGETFGVPRSEEDPTGLDLPSGDLRRGGDFEMWFRLEPQVSDVELESVSLDEDVLVGGEGTAGRARLIWRGMEFIVVESVNLESPEVTGGENVDGNVRISGAAPQGGITVQLESDDRSVLFSNGEREIEVRVEAGGQEAPFQVTTTAVPDSRDVTISARLLEAPDEAAVSTTLRVQAPTPDSLALSPTVISIGGTSQGLVFLSGQAPEGGITLGVRSSNSTVFVPREGVPVEAGEAAAAFEITDEGVLTTKPRFADITVTYEGVSQTARLTVSPFDKPFDKTRDKFTDKIAKDTDIFTGFRTRSVDPASAARPETEPDDQEAGGEAFIRPEERPEVERPEEPENQ